MMAAVVPIYIPAIGAMPSARTAMGGRWGGWRDEGTRGGEGGREWWGVWATLGGGEGLLNW